MDAQASSLEPFTEPPLEPEGEDLGGGDGARYVGWTEDLAPGEQTLDQRFQAAILEIIRGLDQSDEMGRRREVKDAREAREFWNGNHWIAWDERELRWQPADTPLRGQEDQDQDYPSGFYINHYLGYGLDFCAAVTLSRAKTPFYPSDPDDSASALAARKATDYVKHFRRVNNDEALWFLQGYYLFNDGMCATYTRARADAQRFGTYQVPELMPELVQISDDAFACPKCGTENPVPDFTGACASCERPLDVGNFRPGQRAMVPQVKAIHEYANAEILSDVYGRLEVRCTGGNTINSLSKLELALEIHRARMRANYPKLAEKIVGGWTGGATDSTYEIAARRSLNEGSNGGVSGQNKLITWRRVWLSPMAFFDHESKEDRDELLRMFPDGALVVLADETFCEARGESMNDHWELAYAYPQPTHYGPSIGSGQIPAQKAFNDLLNIRIDTHRYGVATMFANPKVIDPDAYADGRVQPGAIMPAKPYMDRPITQDILFGPTAEVSPDAPRLAEELVGEHSQRVTGIVPAVYGGVAKGAGETASGYDMMRSQARMRLQIPFGNLRRLNYQVDLQAVRLFREHGTKDVMVVGNGPGSRFTSENVSVDDLKGDILIIPDSDEGIPLSPEEKRGFWMQQLANPAIAQLIMTPQNESFFKSLTQAGDLKLPSEDAREHQKVEILDLKQGNPALAPVHPLQDHPTHMAVIKEWIESEDGRRAQVEDPAWFQAVVMHYAEHQTAQIVDQREQQMAAMALQGPPGIVPPLDPNAQPGQMPAAA